METVFDEFFHRFFSYKKILHLAKNQLKKEMLEFIFRSVCSFPLVKFVFVLNQRISCVIVKWGTFLLTIRFEEDIIDLMIILSGIFIERYDNKMKLLLYSNPKCCRQKTFTYIYYILSNEQYIQLTTTSFLHT